MSFTGVGSPRCPTSLPTSIRHVTLRGGRDVHNLRIRRSNQRPERGLGCFSYKECMHFFLSRSNKAVANCRLLHLRRCHVFDPILRSRTATEWSAGTAGFRPSKPPFASWPSRARWLLTVTPSPSQSVPSRCTMQPNRSARVPGPLYDRFTRNHLTQTPSATDLKPQRGDR